MKRLVFILLLMISAITSFSQIDEGFTSCHVTIYNTTTWEVQKDILNVNKMFFTSNGNLYTQLGDYEIIYNMDEVTIKDDLSDIYYAVMVSIDGIVIGFNSDYVDIISESATLRYWRCQDENGMYNQPVQGW